MRITIIVATIVVLCSAALAAPTAEELYNAGQAAYDGHNYALAIDRWQEAYRLSKEPGLLFNVAQAYRLANDCENALSTYKHFIATDPTSERRHDADELVHELEGTCGSLPSHIVAPRPVETTRPLENTRPGQQLKLAGLVIGGSGAVLLVSGLVLGKHASTLGGEVTSACATSCDWAIQNGKDAAGRRDAAIGYALDVAGVAGIAGGAIMYYLGDRAHAVTVSPRPRDGGAVFTWSGAW